MTAKPRMRVKAGRGVTSKPAAPVSAPSAPKVRAGYMRDTQSGVLASRPSSLREHRDEVRRVWTRAAGLAMDLLQNSGKLRGAADQILVDAKAPKGAVLPGGNGLSFDWTLIARKYWPCPWMLAGGLTPENVAEAIRLTGARQVDVSSGVEIAPGVKDAGLIRAFLAAATGAP